MPTARQILRWPHRLFLTTHLALLASILILWPLSHFYVVGIGINHGTATAGFVAAAGRCHAVETDNGYPPTSLFRFVCYSADNLVLHKDWSYTDWGKSSTHDPGYTAAGLLLRAEKFPHLIIQLAIPFSYLTLLLLIYPTLTYRHHRKSRPLPNPSPAFPVDPSPTKIER